MTERKNWIMGIWKFRDSVMVDALIEFAEKRLLQNPRYLQLYIRRASKNQIGLGFTFDLSQSGLVIQTQDEYFEITSDLLKRNFGNDFVGWDIASDVTIVK